MTYAQGSQIAALDYNTFAQGGASVNHAVANINTVWGVGQGNKGYGQATVLTPVATGTDTVTATQWSTLISRLNSILTHQAGAGSGITAPTAGTTVAYLSALSTGVTNAYNNRANAATNATDVTAAPIVTTWTTANPGSLTITRTATWANADQARYFFNAGGTLQLTTSATDASGTAKGTDWVSLIGTKLASIRIGGTSNSRTGTGGTTTSTNTAIGYWTATTTDQNIITLTSASGTADYSANNVAVSVRTNGVQGSNGDNGTVMTFTIVLFDPAGDSFNDNVGLSVSTNVVVRPPETTNLPTAIANPVIDSTANSSSSDSTASSFSFTPTISANTTSYNLKAAAIAAGWDQVKPLAASVTIASSVVIGAINTSAFAFDTGATFPSGTTLALSIASTAYVVGAGGNGGGPGGGPGGPGGPALRAQYAISVTNNGTVGGGGGGGGGGANADGFGLVMPGGGGGGGQGHVSGSGGAGGVGVVNSAAGTAGTATNFGIGGNGGYSDATWYGGKGGNGGAAGSAGNAGAASLGGDVSAPGAGGAAGAAVVGNSFITWVTPGTRLGAIT